MGERSRPRPLPEAVIREKLEALPSWTREGRCLARDIVFPGFTDAVRFIGIVADHAERIDHHPDILLSYRRMTIRLSSHDAGGVTDRDFRLAGLIEESLRRGTTR